MDTIPITSPINTSEDNRTNSNTDLSIVNMEEEMHTDLSTWTPAEKKKLQHMTEFHEEYQCVFGKQASLHTIMKCRISHMNPPIPKSVCEEEMQNANLDTTEIIIEYITDAVKEQNGLLVCEGTICGNPIPYVPMLIPGQLRFSLYSGGVITEGRCGSIHCLLWFLS